jgi:hypothetical protein
LPRPALVTKKLMPPDPVLLVATALAAGGLVDAR